jgi:replicative DNA helicase Mcm
MLAAANPKRGRFDGDDIGAQINLPPTLLSRFDMIFTLKDRPNAKNDKRITDHILNVHRRGQAMKSSGTEMHDRIMEETDSIRPSYEMDILRKYVAYAKKNVIPMLSDEAFEKISRNYLEIRGKASNERKSVPITARQLEAYIRLSEASAKARLSGIVTESDADRAIRLIHYYLDKVIGGDGQGNTTWDIDRVATGMPANVRDEMTLVRDAIIYFAEENEGKGITKTELIERLASQMDAAKVMLMVNKLTSEGDIYSPAINIYRSVQS